MFASPERKLLFDLNDFDETLPGPFEYDVKRMAASFTIAARNNGFSKADKRASTPASVAAYREAMAGFADMRTMDIWYAHLAEDELMAAVRGMVAEISATVPRTAAISSSSSRWAYQMSIVRMSAKPAIASLYAATDASVDARVSAFENPLLRAAIVKLAAIRFTSYSNGPGRVSSKLFRSNSSFRSGEANTPKLTDAHRRTTERPAPPSACP